LHIFFFRIQIFASHVRHHSAKRGHSSHKADDNSIAYEGRGVHAFRENRDKAAHL
jgi:hypothetical protein